MNKALIFAILTAFSAVTMQVQAHEGHNKNTVTDLKTLPASQQVETIEHCKGTYGVKFKNNSTMQFQEFDLRFKTDSGSNGPNTGNAVFIPAGMGGDRAFIIFSDPGAMMTFFKKC